MLWERLSKECHLCAIKSTGCAGRRTVQKNCDWPKLRRMKATVRRMTRKFRFFSPSEAGDGCGINRCATSIGRRALGVPLRIIRAEFFDQPAEPIGINGQAALDPTL
jgi:hypothetical protein